MKINSFNYPPYCSFSRGNNLRLRQYQIRLRQYQKSNKLSKSLFSFLSISALMILLGSIFGLIFVRGFDKYIENQDTMLCESAKISGNTEYLEKCQCYYLGEPITCLQK